MRINCIQWPLTLTHFYIQNSIQGSCYVFYTPLLSPLFYGITKRSKTKHAQTTQQQQQHKK